MQPTAKPPTDNTKVMKLILQIALKEEKIDKAAVEGVFEAWKLAAERATSKAELEDGFHRNLGRKYGPKSRTYFDMVQSIRTRLAQKDPAIFALLGNNQLLGNPTTVPTISQPSAQPIPTASVRVAEPLVPTTQTIVPIAPHPTTIYPQQQSIPTVPTTMSQYQQQVDASMHMPKPISNPNMMPMSNMPSHSMAPATSLGNAPPPVHNIQNMPNVIHSLPQSNFPPKAKLPEQFMNNPKFPSAVPTLNPYDQNLQEIERITEKVNLLEEGITTSDHSAEGCTIDIQTVQQERLQSRQQMRDYVTNRIPPAYPTTNTTTTTNTMTSSYPIANPNANRSFHLEDEHWKTQNVITMEVIQKLLATKYHNHMKISLSTQKYLIEAIQLHLKSILESAIEISRKRLNRSAITTYNELNTMMIQNNGKVDHENQLSIVSLKWGPPIIDILKREDTEARHYLKKYMELDEKQLKEKMKYYDEEKMKAYTLKKKPSNDNTTINNNNNNNDDWWDIDKRNERNAQLTLQELSDVYFKQEVSNHYLLGPYAKKPQKPRPDEPPMPLVTSTTGFVIDLHQEFPSLSKATTTNNQSCPILPTSELKITVEDILYMINKITARKGAIVGVRFTQDMTLAGTMTSKWKLITHKPY